MKDTYTTYQEVLDECARRNAHQPGRWGFMLLDAAGNEWEGPIRKAAAFRVYDLYPSLEWQNEDNA